ncbi:MAG: DUF1440 domain-containing protein [Acidobacteriaceae bacterium]
MNQGNEQSGEMHPVRGVLAGLAGGLIAAFVMNEFQAALSKATEALKEQKSSPQQAQHQDGEQQDGREKPDDATQKAADRIAAAVTGVHLTKQQKEIYGPMVHYGMGAVSGIVYGVAAECLKSARIGFGTLFGTVLFVLADEIAVPALGLSQSPTEQPATAQITPWLSHLVYGLTVESVCWTSRKIF